MGGILPIRARISKNYVTQNRPRYWAKMALWGKANTAERYGETPSPLESGHACSTSMVC